MMNFDNKLIFETINRFSVKDLQNHFEPILDKKDLEFANWMYEKLGFDSFFHYFKLDIENLIEAQQDPTKAQNTLFVKSLKRLKDDMSNPLSPKKIFVFFKMWSQSKKLEKLTVQLFTHLFSYQETRSGALKLKNELQINNAFHKTQHRKRNIDFALESIESIVIASKTHKFHEPFIENTNCSNEFSENIFINNLSFHNTNIKQEISETLNVNNNFYNFEGEAFVDNTSNNRAIGFQYLKSDFSKLLRFADFLEKYEYIENSKSFYQLFIKEDVVNDFRKVSWLKNLSSLCFLVHALMVLEIIPYSAQWAKLTSKNFISLSKRKQKPEISPNTLTSIKEKMELATLSYNGLKNNTAFQVDDQINLIRQILLEIYEQ